MINAIIIDDESGAIDMLEWLLTTYCPEVNILAKCIGAEQGIASIRALHPQLVFLDIEMPGMNGFDLLEKLAPVNFEVIFTTAYDQFAVRAFRFAALDYLLKPIDPEDLQNALSRFKENQPLLKAEQINLLIESMQSTKKLPERIALSAGNGLVFVNTSEITYCQADSNYTHVMMQDGKKITVARTLKDIDETLAGEVFIRVHNSYLVNMNHIKKYVKEDGGYIVMPDDTAITISRNKRDDFFQRFSKF